jgi:hypothetical protein
VNTDKSMMRGRVNVYSKHETNCDAITTIIGSVNNVPGTKFPAVCEKYVVVISAVAELHNKRGNKYRRWIWHVGVQDLICDH